MPYPGWSPKDIRMYKHILDSSGSKKEAASTVNAYRSKHGKTKAQKRKRAR